MLSSLFLIASAATAAADLPPPDENAAEISVLTYNVRGLPWPIAQGRDKALPEIGRELAALRKAGRQPTVVLIQEGFRPEVAELVKTSGYAYWAQGPGKADRPSDRAPATAKAFRAVRYLASGEGWGKFTGAGLHVLSDLPIVDVRRAAYRYCAGWDCLANKGVMMVRVQLHGAPVQVDIVNTHMNSKRAAQVPRARSSQAHNLQTEELLQFVDANRDGWPMLIGGDFNMKGAPERYDYKAKARPYTVVSEYCSHPERGCAGETAPAPAKPWLASQDLQAFESRGAVEVRPARIDKLFTLASGRRLSDHDGYLVRYRLSWNGEQLARATEAPQPEALAFNP